MMTTFAFNFKSLERTAAEAMLAGFTAPFSATVSNPFFQSLRTALDVALNNPTADGDEPPKYDGRLETLSETQLAEVITVFDVFFMTFSALNQPNAARFCEQVREIASAQLLARLSEKNPPGRFFPEVN